MTGRQDEARTADGAADRDPARELRFSRSLLASLTFYVLVVDRGGYITYANAAAKRLLSDLPAAGIGAHLCELLHQDDTGAAIAAIAEVARLAGVAREVEFRLRGADRAWRWLSAELVDGTADPVLNGIVVNARDVTRQRRERLQYRKAERLARLGIWQMGMSGREFSYSDGFTEFLGYGRSDFTRDPEFMYTVIHPDDRERVRGIIRTMLRTGIGQFYNCRAQAADGSWRTVSTDVFVELDANGEAAALIGVSQDISEREEALTALQKSEAQHRLLTEQASDIIARADPDGTVTFVSPASRRILGYEPEELLGHAYRTHLHPDDTGEVVRMTAGCTRGEPDTSVTFRMRHRDGRWIWLEVTSRAVFGEGDETPTGYIYAARDVSERKTFELDLMAARERAETASRTKSRFLANMSHELRTPLNAILGFSELISSETFGPTGSPKYTEYANLIFESGTLLLELINDLLDMSKIEAGKYELYREPIDLHELVQGCVRIVGQRAVDAGLALTVTCPTPGPVLDCDKRAMKQILLNLLSNAIKFTPRGGRIGVGLEESADAITLTVTDSGIGIPAEDLPRLGQPFEQVVDDHTLAQSGSGLGLALVKALARMHEGTMEIRSTVGEGTTVSVRLPSRPGALAAAGS
ncbi:MAG: PAS domain S-box protein [Alphaproteobacteria bacterium]|nr:PAS domain S-box protein [Alphaproteobacteria bacterium]